MTFNEVITKLCDGKRYIFGHDNLLGYFHKAPHPANPKDTAIDGAVSAITYYINDKPGMPTLMLYDFDDDDECSWYCNEAFAHPLA